LEQDLEYLNDRCEPWMVHVLLDAAEGKTFDSKLIGVWRLTRSTAYPLYPYKGTPQDDSTWRGLCVGDTRLVHVLRNVLGRPSIDMPYLHYCKLMATAPVKDWKDLPFDCEQARALRTVAYGLAADIISRYFTVASYRRGSTFSLTSLRYNRSQDRVCLSYENGCNTSLEKWTLSAANFYKELVQLPGLTDAKPIALTSERAEENAMFRTAIIDRRLTITMEDIREARRKFGKPDVQDEHNRELIAWLEEQSNKRCRAKRRSSKRQNSKQSGEPVTKA